MYRLHYTQGTEYTGLTKMTDTCNRITANLCAAFGFAFACEIPLLVVRYDNDASRATYVARKFHCFSHSVALFLIDVYPLLLFGGYQPFSLLFISLIASAFPLMKTTEYALLFSDALQTPNNVIQCMCNVNRCKHLARRYKFPGPLRKQI
jgi:hypothetical protein